MDAHIINFLRTEVREFCVDSLVLRTINSAFNDAGFSQDTNYVPNVSGQRRTLVEQYYASEDWKRPAAIQKLLRLIERILLFDSCTLTDEKKEELRDTCRKAGLSIHENGYRVSITYGGEGVKSELKNLIFATNGPKPEIVLSDAISNKIEIVKNKEYCLVYDRPLQPHGLRWSEMCDWWREQTHEHAATQQEVSRRLYQRLYKSLQSRPEQIFFEIYFEQFCADFDRDPPILIPQVYLHYDPYTLKQRSGVKTLLFQRMDFLLLLPENARIVIEIDGKQHYAEGDKPSPKRYAQMVAEDRNLQLAGYEVYRFGAYELLDTSTSKQMIGSFFESLFRKHHVDIVNC